MLFPEFNLHLSEVGATVTHKSTHAIRCGKVSAVRQVMYSKTACPSAHAEMRLSIGNRVRRNGVGTQHIGKHAASVRKSA